MWGSTRPNGELSSLLPSVATVSDMKPGSHGSKATVTMVREQNCWLVVRLLRNLGVPLTKGAIARGTGSDDGTRLTRAAVGSLVGVLQQAGLVVNQPSEGKREMLAFNANAGFAIGIDMARTRLRVKLADLNGKTVADYDSPDFQLDADVDRAIQAVAAGIHEVLTRGDAVLRRSEIPSLPRLPLSPRSACLLGIGLGMPGPLDLVRGQLVRPPFAPGWNGVDVRARLAEALGIADVTEGAPTTQAGRHANRGLPIYVDNDANMGALGVFSGYDTLEGLLGQELGGTKTAIRDLIYVILGSGIGSGLILDGMLYRGSRGSAGEIGHVTLANDLLRPRLPDGEHPDVDHLDVEHLGALCKCGKYGCLEAEAGASAIIARALAGDYADLSEDKQVEKVIDRARRGDDACRAELERAGKAIGLVLAELVNFINPSAVVLDGPIAQAGERILGPIRTAIEDRTMPAILEMGDVKVLAVPADTCPIAVGGVATVLNHELEEFVIRAVDRAEVTVAASSAG